MPSINSDSFKALLNQNLDQSFSPVLVQLIKKTVDQDASMDEVAKLIALDPLLTASVLGIANSAHYSYGKNVATVERAITVLGLREILKLAVSISIKKNLNSRQDRDKDDIALDWRLTIWSAVAAEQIGKVLGDVAPGQAYLAAILKDIPLMLMNLSTPQSLRTKGSIVDYDNEQDQKEIDTWGLTHSEMSEIMAENWGLPNEIAKAMRLHHTPIMNAAKESPLALSLALGTKWSELLQGTHTTPEAIFNFELILGSALNIDDSKDLEEIRLNILRDFKEILLQLDILEPTPDQRLYENSLSSLKNYYFMALDLADTANDLPSLAQAFNNHLSMFWQISSWDLALRIPNNNTYLFFSAFEGAINQSGPLPLENWAEKNAKKISTPFKVNGKHFGELLVPKHLLMGEKLQFFCVYASFVSQSLGNYYTHRLADIARSSMLEELPIPVASLSLNGNLLNANKQFCKFFNLKDLEMDNIPKLLDDHFATNMQEEWADFLKRAACGNANNLISRSTSTCTAPEVYLTTLKCWEVETAPKLLLFIQSITELTGLEAQALKQRDFLEHLFSSMQDIVLTIDKNGIVTWAAPALKPLIGKDFFALSRPANPQSTWDSKLLDDSSCSQYPLEAGMKIPGRRVGLFEFLFSPLGNKSSEYLVVGRDLTNIRRLEAKVRQQAIRDGLTGLFNHSYFHNLMEAEITRQSTDEDTHLGLLFMDLDGFKAINDTEGHLAGDNILKTVGSILKANLRKGRDFAARYGGDEFAVLATNVDKELLESIGNRIIEKVLEQTDNKIGLSIGAALLKTGQENASEFLRRADKALYEIKSQGGNKVSWGSP